MLHMAQLKARPSSLHELHYVQEVQVILFLSLNVHCYIIKYAYDSRHHSLL